MGDHKRLEKTVEDEDDDEDDYEGASHTGSELLPCEEWELARNSCYITPCEQLLSAVPFAL